MDINITEKDGISIAGIIGNLDTATSFDAQEKILPLITKDIKIIIDMIKCEYVSSAGLRTLLLIAKKIRQVGAKGVMSCVSDEIKDVMEMTGFDDMFDTFLTVDEAINVLKGA